jgi:hypothetical protein
MMDVRKNKRRVKICVLSMGGYKDGERNTHIQKRVQYILHAIGVCVCVWKRVNRVTKVSSSTSKRISA